MNEKEFSEFSDYMRETFAGFDSRASDPDKGPGFLRAWAIALKGCVPSDAYIYAGRVYRGDEPAPKWPSDWDTLAACIRVWCEHEAKRRELPPDKPPRPSKEKLERVGDAMRSECHRQIEAGRHAEFYRSLLRRFDQVDNPADALLGAAVPKRVNEEATP